MVVRAYGKINLYLDVLHRRPDGYTNIETVFQTVSLHDTLGFEPRDTGLTLTCGNPALDTGESNLILRAARLLQERTGCGKGARIHLDKQIPIAGGMAGGSVDAAATLRALNDLWELDLDERALAEIALALGSDVPYCLTGGTVAATGRGERLEPLDPLPETWFVLVQPGLEISAGSVYNHPALTRNEKSAANGKTPAFKRAIEMLKEGRIADTMFNQMESAILAIHPELSGIKEQLIEAGCLAAMVSGSGPTIVGLCESNDHANSMCGKLTQLDASAVHSVSAAIVQN